MALNVGDQCALQQWQCTLQGPLSCMQMPSCMSMIGKRQAVCQQLEGRSCARSSPLGLWPSRTA